VTSEARQLEGVTATAPGAEPLAQPPEQAPPIRRRTARLLLGAILLAALALRLWNLDHGLPFAYNADEAEHFVPRAVGMFRGSLDPGYYENPPALTYLLYLIFELRFSGGRDFVRGFAADPEPAFLTARVAVALVGTLVVGLAYWAGARFFDRRTGLVAAALMAVAFLPVFYSKHALNDIVTLAPVSVALVGALLAYERGRWFDWALAGGAIGAATATKYTAGAMLVTVVLAAALRFHRDRSELDRTLAGLAVAGVAFAALFLALNPYSLLNFDEARRQVEGQSDQADSGKLGQDDVRGWFYYVGALGWGFGWAPLAAAVGGLLVALRRDRRRTLLLIAFPLLLYLFLGGQGRFFGRWLLPAYPMLCVLAGYGVVALAGAIARRPRPAAALVAGLAALAGAQGVIASVHVDTVLGRTDTRAQALRWIGSNVPAGAPLVVEPFVPASWLAALDRPVWPVERPFQAYEKRLRVRHIERYRERGHCWVVVGSTQKQRGLKAGLRSSRNYYRALEAASAETVAFSPYARGAAPVEFSYDFSFNYAPRAYERPGPLVEIHRLSDCRPAVR
jgi:4-amino-4-deoxy-L-arabinose transferase-like glycosyltransferase